MAHNGDEESNSPTKLSCMLAFSLISSDTDFFQPPHFQGSLCSSTWVVLCLSGEQPNYTSLFLIPQGTLKSHHSFSRAFPFQTTPFPSTLNIAGQPRSEIYLPSPTTPTTFVNFSWNIPNPLSAQIYTSFSQSLKKCIPGNVHVCYLITQPQHGDTGKLLFAHVQTTRNVMGCTPLLAPWFTFSPE